MNKATQAEQEFRVKHNYAIRSQADSDAQGSETNANNGNPVDHQPTLAELEVTSQTYRSMYESFLQAYTNSVNQQTYSPPNARIITAAAPPLSPTYPRPKLVLTFGILGGMLVGVGSAFARQTLDNSIRTQQQIRNEVGLDCLGTLPPPPRSSSTVDRYSIISHLPPSNFGQNLASIKTVIDVTNRGRPVRLLGVVSASHGDGKSILAGNLASLSAINGIRTLVIDADIHQLTLSKNLVRPESKVSEYGMNMPIHENIISIEGQSFDLLSSRGIAGSSILSPHRLKSVLEKLDRYDLIIFDLPDLRSGIDGLAICSLLDGVVISAKWGKTSTGQLMELVRLLHSLKATMFGVVITNFGAKPR
jgi:Mrp family chromosome partitioning ATPase